ncbi:hypothetical protein [Zunongwangia atlantica]|uniref:Uncharacterized protein n=1 Tax=Zunongwangia atlantica 22II14-10F7 TaxID=1185767 RepID=A0A1Y1SXP5_9FLAO|nr:hypothetical protein [Zunongwangia atlantica]ORL43518.1 hypothetical protein IIF7_20394 [Zunongwangia atlantica 22II14-10F7]
MNIDELTKKIRKVSSEKNIQELSDFIQKWKFDKKNVLELRENVERYLGHARFDKKADFDKVYEMWSDFRDSAINRIDGMTMNERLYWFGLFELFENTKNETEQEKYYSKLMAKK